MNKYVYVDAAGEPIPTAKGKIIPVFKAESADEASAYALQEYGYTPFSNSMKLVNISFGKAGSTANRSSDLEDVSI